MSALDLIRAALDRATTLERGPAGIVRSDLAPRETAFVMRTTLGVFLIVHPDVLDRLPKAEHDPSDPLRAVFGVPILDALPDDAAPLLPGYPA